MLSMLNDLFDSGKILTRILFLGRTPYANERTGSKISHGGAVMVHH